MNIRDELDNRQHRKSLKERPPALAIGGGWLLATVDESVRPGRGPVAKARGPVSPLNLPVAEPDCGRELSDSMGVVLVG
jgi:hypothetical protein